MKELFKEIVNNLIKATENDNITWIKKKVVNQWNEKSKILKAYDDNGTEFIIDISWVLPSGNVYTAWQKTQTILKINYKDMEIRIDHALKEINDLGNLIISKYYPDFVLDNDEFKNKIAEINSNIAKLNRDKKIDKIIDKNGNGGIK